LENYEINKNTIAVIPVEKSKTKIIESNNTFFVSIESSEIISQSCRYFGSSLSGRQEGTKYMIGITHKAPIVIEESSDIIFFPTTSPRLESCSWISLKHIYDYSSIGDKTEILFENGCKIDLDMSYGSFDNQVLRATRLAAVLRKRKNVEKIA